MPKLFLNTDLNVQLVDPDGQIGIRVKIEVIHGLLDAVQNL